MERHMTDSGQTRVGFIGTGVMGASMAGHLLAGGHPLTVYSRTREKAAGLNAEIISARAEYRNNMQRAEVFYRKITGQI